MIFVRDKGRMCNNILQYGHLYAWGREHGRATMSMRFAYKYQYFRICHTRHHNFPTYVAAKYAARWGLIPTVSFNDDAADGTAAQEQALQRHRLVVAEGWYARWYDLFLKYKPEIVSLFQFDEAVRRGPDRLLAGLPTGAVRLGVHIRRGDYRTWCDGRYYFDDEHYIGWIRQFLALHPQQEVQVFICGNDPQLDQQAYRSALPHVSVSFPAGNPGEDLYLLSRCHWLLGAPSTFTLVAALYNDTPLCWLQGRDERITPQSFSHFDHLFRHII